MKSAKEYKGKVDFGVIAILYDEFDAALSGRFRTLETVIGSNDTRRYAISRVKARNSLDYLVALARSPDQGHGPAQALADDMIDDLSPRWLMVIGIGGCIPSDEYSLGDVLVANVVPDFSLQAVSHGRPPAFDIRGGEVHQEVEALVAHLPAMKAELKDWSTKRAIKLPIPVIDIPEMDSDSLYGPEDWRRKVIQSLAKRFPLDKNPRQPLVWTGPIGTSNTLVKEVDLMAVLLTGVRSIVAVEMETGGVRRAARRKGRNIPVLTIRGISDVIGLKREPLWTSYACHSAASFAYSLIRTGEVLPPKPTSSNAIELCNEHGPEIAPSRISTSDEHFVGRKDFLRILDEAWLSSGVHILTIVAWAGMGKTALVQYWLGMLAKDGWRGVEKVFDWSFQSQGARVRSAASADVFVDEALRWFGDPDPAMGSPWDRGIRLANLVAQQRTLLILDGLEPLQHPPGIYESILKDPAIEGLLKTLALKNPGLCVVTTRQTIAEIAHLKETTCPTHELKRMDSETGAVLLRLLRVKGPKEELEDVTKEFAGHPLSLRLLGNYLYNAFEDHDIRHWREVSLLEEDAEQGGHARRVLRSYQKWLGKNSREVATLRLLGLFDQSVNAGLLTTLRNETIKGLTDSLAELPERGWNRLLTRLEKLGLLHRNNQANAFMVDCHPIVREHFAEDLRVSHPQAYQEAHQRLYSYLRDKTPQFPDSILGLMPLFQAVRHGCLAELHQKAFDEIYWPRILREEKYFSWKQLGIFTAGLASLSYFMSELWDKPHPSLKAASQAEVLSEAGIALRAICHTSEATKAWEASLALFEQQQDWLNASVVAGNLCELHAMLGNLEQSVHFGSLGVHFADLNATWQRRVINRAKLAFSLHLEDKVEGAKKSFEEAESIQNSECPEFPFLSSVQGYYYCNFLLSHVDLALAETMFEESPLTLRAKPELFELLQWTRERAIKSLKRVTELQWVLSMALDHLTLARVAMLESILLGNTNCLTGVETEFGQCLDLLRLARQQQELPRGLLARAEFLMWQERWIDARADLDEAQSIAERSSMRLFLADNYRLRSYFHLMRYRKGSSTQDLKESYNYVKKLNYLVQGTGYLHAKCGIEAANKLLMRTPFTATKPYTEGAMLTKS